MFLMTSRMAPFSMISALVLFICKIYHKYIIGSTLKIILQISDCLSDSLMRRVSTHQILRIIAPYRVYPSTLDICGARKTVDLQQL